MEYRQLGSSGLRVSAIGLGTNQFGGKVDQQGVEAIIGTALDAGVNLIDTADIYQAGRSEITLGKALEGKWDQVVIATKVCIETGKGPNDRGASRYHIIQGINASLKRLGTDHIDLYQIHRWDEHTPAEEMLRALDDLIRDGKVRYIGASNFAAWQMAHCNTLADLRSWSAFATIQPHYHMFEREVEREMLPYCDAFGVGILPYFPLAGGFLTGKYKRNQPSPEGSRGESSDYVQRYMTDANYTIVEQLTVWAKERGHTMAELAHTWLLGHPSVCSVISGATKVSHVEQNSLAGDWQLTPQEFSVIEKILKD